MVDAPLTSWRVAEMFDRAESSGFESAKACVRHAYDLSLSYKDTAGVIDRPLRTVMRHISPLVKIAKRANLAPIDALELVTLADYQDVRNEPPKPTVVPDPEPPAVTRDEFCKWCEQSTAALAERKASEPPVLELTDAIATARLLIDRGRLADLDLFGVEALQRRAVEIVQTCEHERRQRSGLDRWKRVCPHAKSAPDRSAPTA